MATVQSVFTSKEAANELGVTDAYVRQLCIEHAEIGSKHGHVWLLTEADLMRIKALPTFGTGPRFKKTDNSR